MVAYPSHSDKVESAAAIWATAEPEKSNKVVNAASMSTDIGGSRQMAG